VNSNNTPHLDENQIIQAVVDESDLPTDVQAHLSACSLCRDLKEGFEQELTNLGELAAQLAPKPQKRIILPMQKSGSRFSSFLDWRSVIAAAAIVAAAFIVVWSSNIARNISEHRTENMTAEMRDAKQLMTEVNSLVDNALPPFYLQLSDGPKPDYDEEFYKFLIPPVEDKSVTSEQGKRGNSLC
jgi:hypothetical protein